MASVAIVFRKDKLNKNGFAPVHLRIIKDRKINYISTGEMLDQRYWDFKKNKVRSSHPNSSRLNNFLLHKCSELHNEVLEHQTSSKSLTTKDLKEKIYGKQPTNFITFAYTSCDKYLQEDKIRTYYRSLSVINKLKAFVKGNQLFFQEITPEFLEEYEKHLREFHRNKINSIHKDMKFFRKLFNDAYRNGIIEHQQIPFLRYKLKQEKTQRIYLTEEELFKIENLKLPNNSRLELHRDMFVFAAYSAGLRVSDVLLLKWNYFDGLHINFTIRKTGQQLSIKLPNKSLDIIQKYKSRNLPQARYIFPMLSENLDEKNIHDLDAAISSGTAYINKNLKVLAEMTNLEKPLSFHISRHTWGTRALRKGISIDKVSKLMGHSAIRETQIYAKIASEEMDKAMEVFND